MLFTKFLPVDDNIVAARYVYYKGEVYAHLNMLNNKDPKEYTFIKKDGDLRGYHKKWTDLKAAELFLCSDEIDIGDHATELLNTGGYDIFQIDTVNDIYFDMVKKRTQFKVIGRVSEYAIWITEGMEFEAKDIHIVRGETHHANIFIKL